MEKYVIVIMDHRTLIFKDLKKVTVVTEGLGKAD